MATQPSTLGPPVFNPVPEGVPRIIPLLAVGAILVFGNAKAPGVLNAILGVIVLYVILTHVDEAERLLGDVPAGLARLFSKTSGGGAGYISPHGPARPGVS